MWSLVQGWHTLLLLISCFSFFGFVFGQSDDGIPRDYLAYPYASFFRDGEAANETAKPGWPCGGGNLTRSYRTSVSINQFEIFAFVRENNTRLSFLLTTGNDQTVFDIIVHPTVNMAAWGFISYVIDLEAVAVDGQNGTLQMIVNNGSLPYYTCSDIQFSSAPGETIYPKTDYGTIHIDAFNVSRVDYSGLVWSVADTTTFTTDGLLANGSRPLEGSIVVTNTSSVSTVSYVSASTSPSMTSLASPNSSSGLSTGAKIGIGVGIPLAAILLALIIIFLLRQRRKNKTKPTAAISPAPTTTSEKPELQGSGYDSTIAGPVKPKSELTAKNSQIRTTSKSATQDTFTELPVAAASSSSPWTHSKSGQLPPELSNSTVSHELAPSPATQPSTQTVSKSPEIAQGSIPSSAVTAQPDRSRIDEALASEADLLVQELGLINMRKKALVSAANAPGVKPEDLPGQRGEDYRELVQREAKLRERIAGIDSSGGAG